MSIFAQSAVLFVAVLHIGFLWLEMFQWDKPLGLRVFNLTPSFASESKALAANQGLYNGFLAAGLIWAVFPVAAETAAQSIAVFFLLCVVVAGLYGGFTVSKKIIKVQALPAVLALVVVFVT